MLRRLEERKAFYFRVHVPYPSIQFRLSNPEGDNHWNDRVNIQWGRNSNNSLCDNHPRHSRVTQPKSRSIREETVRTSIYQKVSHHLTFDRESVTQLKTFLSEQTIQASQGTQKLID